MEPAPEQIKTRRKIGKCAVCLTRFEKAENVKNDFTLPELGLIGANLPGHILSVYCSEEHKQEKIRILQEVGLDPNTYSKYWDRTRRDQLMIAMKNFRLENKFIEKSVTQNCAICRIPFDLNNRGHDEIPTIHGGGLCSNNCRHKQIELYLAVGFNPEDGEGMPDTKQKEAMHRLKKEYQKTRNITKTRSKKTKKPKDPEVIEITDDVDFLQMKKDIENAEKEDKKRTREKSDINKLTQQINSLKNTIPREPAMSQNAWPESSYPPQMGYPNPMAMYPINGFPGMLVPPNPGIPPPAVPQIPVASLLPDRRFPREHLRSPSPDSKRRRTTSSGSRSYERSNSFRLEYDDENASRRHNSEYQPVDDIYADLEPTRMGMTMDGHETDDRIIKLSNQLSELENVLDLKEEQLKMKDERNSIKDYTITNLRSELNEQNLKYSDRIDDLKRELSEAKNMQSYYDSIETDPKMHSGEKYDLIKEIRRKSKENRELEDKINTYKKREQQLRETCEAWKKEVDTVRNELQEKLDTMRYNHEAVINTVKLSYEADLKRLKIENSDFSQRIFATNSNNELLRRQLIERPEAMYEQPRLGPSHLGPPMANFHPGQHQVIRGRGRGRGGSQGTEGRGRGERRGRGGNTRPNRDERPTHTNSKNFNELMELSEKYAPSQTTPSSQPVPPEVIEEQSEASKPLRKYTESQLRKRREKLLERLMEKAAEKGEIFIPDKGGAIEAIWIELGHDKKPTKTTVHTPSTDTAKWSEDIVL